MINIMTHYFLPKRYNRYFISLCAFAVLLLLQACGDTQKLSRIPENGTILAFGDSLTEGYGVNTHQSYPTVLAQLSGRDVINAGISGEVTKDGLARLAKVLDKTDPHLMILLEGGNDILRNQNLEKTKQNLSQMINLAKEKGVQVVLIGVPKKQLFSDVAPLYEELANEHNIVFHKDLIATLIRKPSLKSDSVHFNRAGYKKMAEEIHELLQDNGAL